MRGRKKTDNTYLNQSKDLIKRVSQALMLTKPFIKKFILPPWWEPDVYSSPSGYQLLMLTLAQRLNLDIQSLAKGSIIPGISPLKTKFKLNRNTQKEDVPGITHFLQGQAHRFLKGLTIPFTPDSQVTALSLRQELLETSKFPSFSNLLEWCWKQGIPVLPAFKYPGSHKKPTAMIFRTLDRPIIFLFENRTQQAWQLFSLAHELGHWASGHLTEENSCVSDISIKKETGDNEEWEANRFALELLTGTPDFEFYPLSNLASKQLAQYSERESRDKKIDPGFLALNYGWSRSNRWPVAQGALNILSVGEGNPKELMLNQMKSSFDTGLWSDEEKDSFLQLLEVQ